MKNTPEKKACRTCKKLLALTDENFEPANRSKDGYRRDCRECVNKQPEPSKNPAPCPSADAQPIKTPGKKIQSKIILSLKNHPGLYEKLEQWADDNMRSVNQQILFYLKHDALGKRKPA